MKRSLFRNIFLILNVVVLIPLLGAYCSPYANPNEFWLIPFLGLAFPFLYILNVLFVVFWLIQLKWETVISLIGLAIGNFLVPRYIQFEQNDHMLYQQKRFNLVTFNTHYMGAYDHKDGDTLLFFKTLDALRPDVICFQEFANLGGNYEKPMFKAFFKKYQHFQKINADGLSETYPTGYGVCLFSKYPIVKYGFVEKIHNNSNLTIFADVVMGHDTIRIMNTHLKSIVFDKNDYQTVADIEQVEGGKDIPIWKVKKIGYKLKYAFKERAKQADEIRKKIDESDYPIVICGDFNDAPASYAYETIRGSLKDAFVESGSGFNTTYTGKMPSFRIDYILHDARIQSINYSSKELNFSDHKLVSATLVLP